jgi:hypothetical protein
MLALGLTLSLPFVIYFGDASGDVAQTNQDAVAAVVASYFGACRRGRKGEKAVGRRLPSIPSSGLALSTGTSRLAKERPPIEPGPGSRR